ncbi:MAG: 50S ribosomal protein L4 [Candidatus Woesearchaeota archaeon]
MKVNIINVKNENSGSVDLPSQFSEPVRVDLIRRAVLAIQSNSRQSYGASPMAGKRHSAELSRRRRKYRGSYGKGISRVPRKILSRNGVQMHWVGAVAPGTVGGRRAHPPKSEKIWDIKINDAERRKAIRSALSATMDKEIVSARGHKIPDSYPFVLSKDFESVQKTKDFVQALHSVGLTNELERSSITSIRAGKGTMRGRKYKKVVGPLVVVSKTCDAIKAARNIPGVEVVDVANINVEKLAPGTQAGRLTLYTESAIAEIEKSKLYE